MVNFIIYEDKDYIRKEYESIIHKLMGENDAAYRIYQFASYNNQVNSFIKSNSGLNIFILDIEVPGKSGLDLAREIRASGDMESQLIIVTAHKEMLENTFLNRSLVLNFVSKFDNYEENLFNSLKNAYINTTRHKAFRFKNDGELYRIPYNNIYYFEVDPDSSNVKLHTKDNEFIVKKTISSIMKELNDPRFMKTHKSCIVNLYNIDHVDLGNLIIFFNNKEQTSLFSRNYKKELQDRIMEVI